MKKIILFLAILFIAIFVSDTAIQAQSSQMQTPSVCPHRKVAIKERYKNLDAVGLLVTDYSKMQRIVDCHDREEECSKEDLSKSKTDFTHINTDWLKEKTDYYKTAYQYYSPPVRFDSFINEFIKQIHWEIVPRLKPDASCKVADVTIFKIGDQSDAVIDFMKVPGRLLIVAKVQFFGLPYPEHLNWSYGPKERFRDILTKFGPPSVLMTIQYFRSDGLPFNLENAVLDGKEMVLPLNLSETDLGQRIKWFIGNIGDTGYASP